MDQPFVYVIGDPRDPRQFQHHQNQPNQPEDELSKKVRLGNIISETRLNEVKMFTNALIEVRTALEGYSIDESDTGTSERPALNPSFDEINRGKIQSEYLSILRSFREYVQYQKDLLLQLPPTRADEKHS